MSKNPNESNDEGVDNLLATKSLLRHLPQLRPLQGTQAFTVITELCYYAQYHLESAWNPQNRPKSLAFFQMANHRIAELTRSSTCQDMLQALHTIRSRIAVLETLIKHIDTSSQEQNQTWKQTLDPLVQLIKEMNKLSVDSDDDDNDNDDDAGDDSDDMMSDCSQCSNSNTEDNAPILDTLQSSLTHTSYCKDDINPSLCTAQEHELKHEPVPSKPHYLSPSLVENDGNTSPLHCKQERNDFSDTAVDQLTDSEDEDPDSCSEYSPQDDETQVSSDNNDEENSLFEHQVDLHSTASSSKTSLNDPVSPQAVNNNTKYNKHIMRILETMFFEVYSHRDKLTKEERKLVQTKTGLSSRSITYWFANHKRRYQKELAVYKKSGATSYDQYLGLSKTQKLSSHRTRKPS
ncbi:hypothetical protein VKS41_002399 [Umbelopsis sp. WA50703]